MNEQSMSAILSQVATIATVKGASLGLSRTDKQASKEADMSHNARQGTGRVVVSRLAGAEDRVREINALINEGRETLNAYTTAWGDRRMLPNINIEPFLRAWGQVKNDFDEKVNALIADAPRLLQQAQMNLGTYIVEPPTEEEIAGAFKLEFTMEPIPDTSKYQSTLDKNIEAELKRRFEKNIESAYQQAQNDALQRLAEPLSALVERMEAYSKREEDKAKGITVGREGFFRDTIITNVQDIAAVFRSFNLVGDTTLDKIADQLDAFDGIEAKDLRDSEALRRDTANRAKAILEGLGDWL